MFVVIQSLLRLIVLAFMFCLGRWVGEIVMILIYEWSQKKGETYPVSKDV